MNTIRTLLVAATAAAGLGLAAAPAAHATPGDNPVRPGQFIPELSDTRATGSYEFLADGLRVVTQGNTSTDKVAEYFRTRGGDRIYRPIPTRSKMTWYGTQPQPGVQIVFDADTTSGNGNDYNVLVGEPVYGVDADGFYTDWWLTNGSSAPVKAAAPTTGTGSGSPWHGSLTQWRAAFPEARVFYGGFSLGSGVKGDGVIRSITYGDNLGDSVFRFTNTPAPTPAPAVVDVTGTVVDANPAKRTVALRFTADPTPPGATEGKRLAYIIKVDGRVSSRLTQGAGDVDDVVLKFRRHTGKHTVIVADASGVTVARFTARTR